MKFDVVVGNPPYNKDDYIDFVLKGYQFSNKYTVMIVPAKWQMKGGKKNAELRDSVKDYISKLVYYKNVKDIFDVALDGGVCYFLMNKDTCDFVELVNVVNSTRTDLNVSHLEVFDITLARFVEKLFYKYKSTSILQSKDFSPTKSYFCGLETADPHLKVDNTSKYRLVNQKYNIGIPKSCINHSSEVGLCKLYATHYMNTATTYFILGSNEVSTRGNILLYRGSLDECKSAESYYTSSLVKYLSISSGLGSICKECFTFVPDPGSFDRVFEDYPKKGYRPNSDGEYIDAKSTKHCSLYVKYGLTADEINVIESVVK